MRFWAIPLLRIQQVNLLPPATPTPNPLQPVADAVVAHFSSHWETFKEGFRCDVTAMAVSLYEEKKGLVHVVLDPEQGLQKIVLDETTGLRKRVSTLETVVAEVKNGKTGEKSLAEKLTDISSRLDVVERQAPAQKVTATTPHHTPEETSNISARLDTLEQQCNTEGRGLLQEIKTLKDNLEKVQDELYKIANFSNGDPVLITPDIQDLRNDIFLAQKDVEVVTGRVHCMGQTVEALDHRSTMNAAKLMRNQLIFGGVKNLNDAPAIEALKVFLRNIMKIVPEDTDILDAFPLGTGYTKRVRNKDITFPPPIRARCSAFFAQKVMNNAFKLAGKQDQEQGYRYFVKRCRPESHRAIREKHSADIRSYKEKNKKATTAADITNFKFDGHNFIVNNKIVEEDIRPPSFRDMLLISADTQRKIEELQTFESPHVEKNGSWFQAYAIRAESLADVELGYLKVKQIKRFADHVMAAYRIKISDSEIQEGCTPDKEYFGDLEMLNVMKVANVVNTAVFVSREYGGKHLGKQRFTIIRDVTTKALQEMSPDTYSVPSQQTRPKARRSPRHRRRRNKTTESQQTIPLQAAANSSPPQGSPQPATSDARATPTRTDDQSEEESSDSGDSDAAET